MEEVSIWQLQKADGLRIEESEKEGSYWDCGVQVLYYRNSDRRG